MVALRPPPVQPIAEIRLTRYVAHLRDLHQRFQSDTLATWHRVVETALRTGHDRNEAEQMADRIVYEGDLP
jgi:hypothetical protein